MKPLPDPAAVDAYIAAFPADVRQALNDIRETIRRAAPTASERISYGMPTFVLDKVIVHFGAFKGHIGLYPPVREPELQGRSLPYRGETGNLRFPLDQPIPHDLIADIVRARVEALRQPSDRLEIRDAARGDAPDLADLLNAIIAQGGTTALEDPYAPERLAESYLVGPTVHCCFVAIDRETGRLEGFQTLGRYPGLPDDIGDIGTFVHIEGKQRGVGSALFAATRERARRLDLAAINATIRADNLGGLTYYRKMGFEDDSVTPAVPLKDGRLVDRVHRRFRLA